MIYTDNCCCCIELKCGCIIIAIVDVLIRGVDHFVVDRDSWLGLASIGISGLYLISCVVLLIGALLGMRHLLLPYILAASIHVLVLTFECAYVMIMADFYDFILFDIFQAGEQGSYISYPFSIIGFFLVLSLYFTLVVYSYYDILSDK